MSDCVADVGDLISKFPTTFCKPPKFSEEAIAVRRTKGKPKPKPTSTARTVASLRRKLDTAIFRLLVTAQSRKGFEELRSELFGEFIELNCAISTLLRLPEDNRVAATDRVFAFLRDQFESDSFLLPRHQGAREEALFCLDTLHRAHFLSQDVREALKEDVLPHASLEAYQLSIYSEWWSFLHLRCIAFAIHHKISPTDEVFSSLLAGFRYSVRAYAHARAAMEPRYEADYSQINFSSLSPHASDYNTAPTECCTPMASNATTNRT